MSKTISYATVQNISQTIRYNEPGTFTDSNGQTVQGYYVCAIITNMQAIGDDGSLRDKQHITPVGAARATIFTPQEIYNTVNSATAGQLLASELKAVYLDAINQTVS